MKLLHAPPSYPRRIKIAGGLWRLRRMRRAGKNCGETDFDKREISIGPGMSAQTMARTIVHEALHAMLDESGVCADPAIARREEKIVAALEAPLASFIADNPALMRRLAEDLKS